MLDSDFLAAFEDCTLAEEFTHTSHLRMAWLILRQDGRARGTPRILEGIRRYAEAKGATTKFHHTMSIFWIHMVDAALGADPEPKPEPFEAFLERNPRLTSSALPFEYYGKERMMGDPARAGWVEPDRKPLP